MSIFDLYYVEDLEPLKYPIRPKYMDSKGHYRKSTYQDKKHKRKLIEKRRNKKRNLKQWTN